MWINGKASEVRPATGDRTCVDYYYYMDRNVFFKSLSINCDVFLDKYQIFCLHSEIRVTIYIGY